jgi:hypothetical protein
LRLASGTNEEASILHSSQQSMLLLPPHAGALLTLPTLLTLLTLQARS